MSVIPELNGTSNRIIFFLTNSTSLSHIRQISSQLILQNLHYDTTIASHFVLACQSLNLLSTAHLLFGQIHKPHVFTCNFLIRAFSHSKIPQFPYSIYSQMGKNSVSPNHYSFPLVLKSLSDFKEFKQGQTIHTQVVKLGHMNDIYVQNSLLNLYASCGYMGLCRNVFDEMFQRDVVSWTVLIMGYGNFKMYDDALSVFEGMQQAGVEPNRVTMVNALNVCAGVGAIEMGIWIHDFINSRGWELDVILGTALIDMFGKCGRAEKGLSVFRKMKEKNVFTWNALIHGLALAKSGEGAVWWFNEMQREKFKPDGITLICVLCACNHSGLVDIGREIFNSIINGKYGFAPEVKHYACVIDMFARAGFLDEAFKLVNEMPFEASKSMWGSLLAGCRDQGSLELSVFVAKKLLELEPNNNGYYVLLSNLYAEMGRWSDVERVRELMKEKGLKKDIGCSSVEPKYQENVSAFLAP